MSRRRLRYVASVHIADVSHGLYKFFSSTLELFARLNHDIKQEKSTRKLVSVTDETEVVRYIK